LPSSSPVIVYTIAILAVALAFILSPITEGQQRNWRRLLARFI
jgi:hypothetical protein